MILSLPQLTILDRSR